MLQSNRSSAPEQFQCNGAVGAVLRSCWSSAPEQVGAVLRSSWSCSGAAGAIASSDQRGYKYRVIVSVCSFLVKTANSAHQEI